MDYKDVSIDVDANTGVMYLVATYGGTINNHPSISNSVSFKPP